MPALDNPRWERFAQAIVEGLANGDRKPYSQGRAYIAAGYTAKDQGKRGGSAECAASRLLNRVKPIIERVRELQAEANKRLEPKLDLSRERVGRRLDLASRMAEHIGRKLLQSVGFASPDDVSVAAAIEANDLFIAKLEAIRDSAQRLTLDQD